MDQTQRHLTTRQGATMNSAVGTGVPPPQTPEALAARVENFARGGASNREIAARLGLTRRWLKRRFRRQLRTGRAVLRMGLRQKQLQVALDEQEPDVRMLLWLGKQYLGQFDKAAPAGAARHAEKMYIGVDIERV